MTATADADLHYLSVPPSEQPQRAGFRAHAPAILTAPLLGSRLLFPKRFDAAVERLLEHPDAAGIAPAHAFWYFGSGLRLDVPPLSLKWRLSDFVTDRRGPRWIGSLFLDAADWSEALSRPSQSPIHKEMHQLVKADLDVRQVLAYHRLQRRALEGRPVSRNGIVLASPDQVDAYFRYCVDLVASMREHGVLPRREMSRLGARLPMHEAVRPRALDRAERDIGVAIAADGRLIRHLGGKHRTAAAKALRLASVPVEVRLVHVRWLQSQMEQTRLPAHQALQAALASWQPRAEEPSAHPAATPPHRPGP